MYRVIAAQPEWQHSAVSAAANAIRTAAEDLKNACCPLIRRDVFDPKPSNYMYSANSATT